MSATTSFDLVVLLCGLGLLAAVAANAVGSRLRIPAPALFLVVAAAASDLVPALGRIPLLTSERIVTIALILILFDGGMHIGWRRFRAAAGATTWVGVAGTAVTAAAIALLCRFALGIDWQAALLLGAALSPTDPAVVFSVLGDRDIRGRSGTILEGESGVNDPVGIALLAALLVAGNGHGGDPFVGGIVEFLLQMAVGGAVGAAGGLLLGVLVRRVRLPNESLYPLRSLAFAVLLYGAAALLHGSGFLAVFVAGILVGDARGPYRAEVRRFTNGLSSLAEIVAFTVLGFSVSWSAVLRPDALLPGLLLAVVLIVVIRPLLVGALLAPIRLQLGERAFVLLAGLKGAVPILLGVMIRESGLPGAERVASIVFVVVLVSVVVQGGLTPQLAAWFRVPMRQVEQQPFVAGLRFEEEPRGVQHFSVAHGSAAEGASLGDLLLGERGWVSLVRRDGRAVRLSGRTRLEAGDEVLAFADPELDVSELFEAPR
ncbi:cation:proton antiporter [Amnibacterium sp. CER49]|uniref:cation:proton antiporter domain-containing protein n=1 Tax=Amnibacterium sp. CER49 TaxID=3039161 RepID=UPI00244C27A9|nr:cation:proton antiporter [Amnibacterium sp. CER49]MDH2445439.1 cation:proton antiporter [Amnibacterium sp. CER49]